MKKNKFIRVSLWVVGSILALLILIIIFAPDVEKEQTKQGEIKYIVRDTMSSGTINNNAPRLTVLIPHKIPNDSIRIYTDKIKKDYGLNNDARFEVNFILETSGHDAGTWAQSTYHPGYEYNILGSTTAQDDRNRKIVKELKDPTIMGKWELTGDTTIFYVIRKNGNQYHLSEIFPKSTIETNIDLTERNGQALTFRFPKESVRNGEYFIVNDIGLELYDNTDDEDELYGTARKIE